jgi:hypothetical protein
MTQRAITVTLVLTLVLAAFVTLQLLRELGNGAVLFLAVLGGAVIWLLPGVFALALPAGAFGGVLLTHADQSTGIVDEDSTREMVRLAVLALMLSMLTVGWLVPMASRQVTGAFAPYQDSVQAVQPEVKPTTLPLDQLIARASSEPEGKQELLRRAARIAPSFLMPLLAGVLVMVRPRWTYKAAVTATLAVFVISVWAFWPGAVS